MFEKLRIKQHMEVTDASGSHVGTVDEVDGDTIKLTRSDSSDGQHHRLSISDIERIADNRIYLKEGVQSPTGEGQISGDVPHMNGMAGAIGIGAGAFPELGK